MRMHRMCWPLVGLIAAAGCSYSSLTGTARVHDTSREDAKGVLARGDDLLPAQPVAAAAVSRMQNNDTPVKPVSATVPPTRSEPQLALRLRASVNGLPITEDELHEAMAQHLGELMAVPEHLRAEAQKQLAARELDRLVERELVLQDAMEKLKQIKKPQLIKQLQTEASKEADKRLRDIKAALKLQTDAEFKAVLQNQGLSVAGMRRQVERNYMMMEYVRNLIFPTVNRISLQQIREYYEENPKEFVIEDRVKWLDIFVDASRYADRETARQAAEAIAAHARAGVDFRELAKKHDAGDSSLRNGEGLGEKRGEIIPAQAEQIVLSLKPGEVGPVIDLGFGFHIVKVADRQYAGRQPLDEKCQSKIRDKLRGIIADREYKRIVKDLKDKATVVVYE